MTIIVFMVAGMSSRFGGNPKQMAIVGPKDETLIEYSVKQALTCNFSKVIFITNPKTEKLFVDIFGCEYNNTPIEYVEQKYDVNKRSRPWGTTDAICSIISSINEAFIMLNGDDIYGVKTFKKGFEMMKKNNINIIGGQKIINNLPEEGKVNRGIIYIENDKVVGLKEMIGISKIENPELHNNFSNVNFIGLQINILKELKIILDKFKKDNEGDKKIECLLPDNLNELIKEKKLNLEFFEIKDQVLGITNPGDELIVKKILSNI